MIGTMVGVIGKVGIFMVCAQTVIYCRPKPVYEKYLKLRVSLIVLVLLLDGVYSRFRSGTDDTGENLVQWEEWLTEEGGYTLSEKGLWQGEAGVEWTGAPRGSEEQEDTVVLRRPEEIEDTDQKSKIRISRVEVEPFQGR